MYTWSRRVARRSLGDGIAMSSTAARWALKDARAHFSDLVDKALTEGPQIVTRHGKQAVVVVAVEEWERRNRRRGDLVEFFAGSPLRAAGLRIERTVDDPREIDL
jgi:prevent-host-death family protein